MRTVLASVALAALTVGFAACSPKEEGIPAAQLFADNCGYCHSLEETDGMPGPHLANIIGREAGSVPGFPYSDALAASTVRWTKEGLDAFLTNSQAHIEGTTMFVALSEEDRAKLIEYITGD